MLLTRLIKTFHVIAAAGVLTASASAFGEDTLRLNFGVYSSNKPSAMVRVFKPTLVELERRMTVKLKRPVDIRMQIAKDYNQGISHLTSGKVDFSRFGPASYIEAKSKDDGVNILVMESKNRAKVFYGIIAVKSDSDITTVQDLKGKSFAFGDEGSTIGRFLSQRYLEKNNIRAHDLSSYEYLGRHDKVGTAVGAGDFDAGALNESTFKKLVAKGAEIRELVRFPNVTKPWIARSGLQPNVFAALQESLLEITDAAALKGLKVDGFLQGNDTDYVEIRGAMMNNPDFFSSDRAVAQVQSTTVQNPILATVARAQVIPSVHQNTVTTPQSGLQINNNGQQIPGMTEASHSGDSITINITLPSNLFVKDGESQNITINLTIPPSLTDSNVKIESAEAGNI